MNLIIPLLLQLCELAVITVYPTVIAVWAGIAVTRTDEPMSYAMSGHRPMNLYFNHKNNSIEILRLIRFIQREFIVFRS
jgi:hypothetical protein